MAGSERLRSGDAVSVVDGTGASVDGAIRDLTSDSLVIAVGRGSRMWASDDVRKIIRRDSRKNGFWIGAGIGIAAAMGICQLANPGPCATYEGEPFHLWNAGLGLGIGGIVGFIADGKMRETLYEHSGSVRVAVSPAMSSAKGLGARVVVAW